MTRKEAERLTHQQNVLMSLGFTRDEAEALRRISMTLRRWHEHECGDENGCIERDEKTGRPYWRWSGAKERIGQPMADREKGAHKRLAAILKARTLREYPPTLCMTLPPKQVTAYIQTDPRGAALYIIRPGDVPEGKDAGAFYNRGICVY